MKISYKIFKQERETVCAPSTDYYSRGNDWERKEVLNFEFIDRKFDSPEKAVEFLSSKYFVENYDSGEYIIIPTYKI